MSYKDLKKGDEVWVKGEYDEHDLGLNKSWIDFGGGDGAWVHVAKIFPASEIERLDVWRHGYLTRSKSNIPTYRCTWCE